MQSYLVKWEMDIAAESPREAAEKALALLRSAESSSKSFKIIVSGGHSVTVDLAAGKDGA